MLSFSPLTPVFVAVQPVDFRRGIDGLVHTTRSVLVENPMEGAVFVFRNRAKTAIKLLFYDGQGYWMCLKRLSSGRLAWWPSGTQPSAPLAARELQILLWNGNPSQAHFGEDWRPLGQAARARVGIPCS